MSKRNSEESNGLLPLKKKGRYSDETNEFEHGNMLDLGSLGSIGSSFFSGFVAELPQNGTVLVTNQPQLSTSNNGDANSDQDDRKRPAMASTTIPEAPINGTDSGNRSQPTTPLFDDFFKIKDIGRPLGEGAYSKVYKIKQRPKYFAVKVIEKSKLLNDRDKLALKNEVDILSSFSHPNIIKFYCVFDEPKRYCLVTELVEGGELFDRIVSKRSYNERDARDICKIVLQATMYCHSKNVAHRDLKPENLLLVSRTNDRGIKIADFGFAQRVTSEQCLLTKCGTLWYVAPEILNNKPYGTKVDMWSLGVIIYILLQGSYPFLAGNEHEIKTKIMNRQFDFHPDNWGHVSQDAKDLICKLLTVDPNKRINAEEALDSRWICGVDRQLSGIDLGSNLIRFRKFNAKRKLRQAILLLMATNKMSAWATQLQNNVRP